MNIYTWNAKDYACHSAAQQSWARELIAYLNVLGTEDILDLGCGDGKVSVELADLVADGSVIGVDNSEAMINLAQESYPANKHPNLSFQIMDATKLSFENRFDVVFSNAVLHWVKNHQAVMAGMYQSLRAGGKILLSMGGKGGAEGIVSALNNVKASSRWGQYFTHFEFPFTFPGVEEYQALLNASGFEIQRLELVPKDMTHMGISGLESWIRTTWLPYTQRIPEAYRDEFIQEVAACYLTQIPLTADGNSHVAMVRLEVEACKKLKPFDYLR